MENTNSPQPVSVRLTRADDGHWYVDVRRSSAGVYRSDSRHASLDEALDRVRLVTEVKP